MFVSEQQLRSFLNKSPWLFLNKSLTEKSLHHNDKIEPLLVKTLENLRHWNPKKSIPDGTNKKRGPLISVIVTTYNCENLIY